MSDIEKGRARYRAAKRRKASLETQSWTDEGARKMRKTDGTSVCEAARESHLNFICSSLSQV